MTPCQSTSRLEHLTILCRTHRPKTITPGGHISYKSPALCVCVFLFVCVLHVCVYVFVTRLKVGETAVAVSSNRGHTECPSRPAIIFLVPIKTYIRHLLFANTSPPNLSLMAVSKLLVTRSTSLTISRYFIVYCFYTFVMMQHCMSWWEKNTFYYLSCFPVL